MNNKIIIVNGPNLNLLGEREQSQYGSTTFEQLTLAKLVTDLKIPLNKVAIELNKKIVNKKKINKIKFKNKDVIEIVHFIGGG